MELPRKRSGRVSAGRIGRRRGPKADPRRATGLAFSLWNASGAQSEGEYSGDEVWQRVLERARLGLGEDVRDLRASAVGRGNIELEVLFGAFPDAPVPAEQLSEGQIAYLCFLALCEFHSESSLLAFDEPEIHLHPELLARVTWMLEEAATTAPILIATHSDRLLDALDDPASAVRICELDERRALRLRCLDRARLAEWLKDYRGFGALRGDGYAPQVIAPLRANGEKC